MIHRQDDTTASDLAVCPGCARDFVVPVAVVDLIDGERCVVELRCNNCGHGSLGAHGDLALTELDRRLAADQTLMHEAVAVLEIAEELEAIDRFVRALRDDHILPEDF